MREGERLRACPRCGLLGLRPHRELHVELAVDPEAFGLNSKVMQELLRHSSVRSTLDVYTQAITPAKHAAQAAVSSLVFSCETNGASQLLGSNGTAALEQINNAKKGHEKAHKRCPFGSSMVSQN
jgi:hypothetical protein